MIVKIIVIQMAHLAILMMIIPFTFSHLAPYMEVYTHQKVFRMEHLLIQMKLTFSPLGQNQLRPYRRSPLISNIIKIIMEIVVFFDRVKGRILND